jgi:adenylate kinase
VYYCEMGERRESETEERVTQYLSRRRCSVIERHSFDKSIFKEKPLIWMMGPTGAGKGTQCSKMHARYGFTSLSSGELMRLEIIEGTERSLTFGEAMKSGKRIPCEVVIDVISQAIVALAEESKGFVIDGFPLTEEQADAFVKEFGEPSLVLHFHCNNRVLRERLVQRNNYDDSSEAIANRFDVFKESTKAVLNKYNAITIHADKSRDEVFSEIEKLMLEHFNMTAHNAHE